jgi:tetratricopeptide (TPR) repeat protein
MSGGLISVKRLSIFNRGRAGALLLPYFLGYICSSLILAGSWGNSSFDSPVRTIRVKVALDESLIGSGVTREEIKSLLLSASRAFKSRFGLRFTATTFKSWNPERNSRSLLSLLNDLRRKVSRGNEEIVLGIVSADRMKGDQCGFTSYAHGHVLIKHVDSRTLMSFVLKHELCHVFGAVDIDEPGSIMGVGRAGDSFDEFTTSVVLINRSRTFLEEPYAPGEEELDELIFLHEQRDRLKRRELGLKFALATLYLMRNRFDMAVDKCLELLNASPDSLATHNLLGSIYYSQGNLDQAIKSYRRAIELNPGLPELHFNLGLSYSKKGDRESAIVEYLRTLQLHPGMGFAQANLGCLYLEMAEADQAIDACRAALSNCPDLAEALCTLGAALIMKSEAMALNEHSTSTDFSHKGTANSMEFDAGQEMVEEAIACCLRAVRLKPSLAEPYNVLGIGYGYLGRTEEAEAEFLKALKIRPNFLEARFNMGILYFRKGELKKAAFQLARIVEANPLTGLGYQVLERVYQLKPIYAYSAVPLQNHDH